MSESLTGVIVNWRTPEHTVLAARALIKDGVAPARIVVVENGSGDGSDQRIAAALPDCRLLALPENVGFARASNVGAAALPAHEAYLFVNSDAFVHAPGSVGRLLGVLRDPAVGVAVPRLLGVDLTLQPSVVPFLAPASALVRASGLSRHVPNRWQPALATHWDHARSRAVQSATGAVLALDAEAWRALDGFDERRPMYVEDHDLLRRAARSGWKTWFVAEAEFVHLGGASAQQRFTAPERAQRVALAEAEMLADHLGALRRRITLAALVAGAGARAVVFGARGDRRRARVEAAWLQGYLGVPGRRS